LPEAHPEHDPPEFELNLPELLKLVADICFLTLALLHSGQFTFSEEDLTSSSKQHPHLLQTYSKMGIAFTFSKSPSWEGP
jgi:hypothetical protein